MNQSFLVQSHIWGFCSQIICGNCLLNLLKDEVDILEAQNAELELEGALARLHHHLTVMARHCRPLIHVSLVGQRNPLFCLFDRNLLCRTQVLLIFEVASTLSEIATASARLHLFEIFDWWVPKIGRRFQDQLLYVKFVFLLKLGLYQDRGDMFCLRLTILHLGRFTHLRVLHQAKVLEKWREPFSVVFGDLGQNDFHGDLFTQTGPHSLILQQLIVALEVLFKVLGFQDENVVGFRHNFSPLKMLPRRSYNILDQLRCWSDELLSYRYLLILSQKFA